MHRHVLYIVILLYLHLYRKIGDLEKEITETASSLQEKKRSDERVMMRLDYMYMYMGLSTWLISLSIEFHHWHDDIKYI